jgi:hypothetical protein
LNQIQNYNQSVRHISEKSKYCKIVQADDMLFSDCLTQMVGVAESDKTIGIVGAYTLLDFGVQSDVNLMGLPFLTTSINGQELCRRYLIEGFYIFGSPTATLLRSDIVRSRKNLYNEDSAIDDTALCLEVLQTCNFGFCHQVLTYTRRYNESLMSVMKQYNFDIITRYICFKKYGHIFLNDDEYSSCNYNITKIFHQAIGESVLRRLPIDFWDFQKFALNEIGENINRKQKIIWAFKAAIDLALNPKLTIERLKQHKKQKQSTMEMNKYIDI